MKLPAAHEGRAASKPRARAAPPNEIPAAKKPRARSAKAPATRSVPTGAAAARVAGVELTHADKIIFPEVGVRKGDLAQYYESVAGLCLPHLARRPLTLVRCPGGVAGPCFVQKRSTGASGEHLVPIATTFEGGPIEYPSVRALAGVVALVQIGALEIHAWNATDADLERPDRLVVDLDAGPGLRWRDVARGAVAVRDDLAARGLTSFVKTSGGSGAHVVVPLTEPPSWDDALTFSRELAERLAAAYPAQFTAQAAKSGRAKKIYLDYLRNARGSIVVAAYSPRRTPRATVSAPLAWGEIDDVDPAALTTSAVASRAAKGDPWEGYFETRQALPVAHRAATRRR